MNTASAAISRMTALLSKPGLARRFVAPTRPAQNIAAASTNPRTRTMTRDELIETMARAASNYACKAIGSDNTWDTASESERNEIRPAFEVALTAIEAAGYAVVPKQASTEMVIAGQETFLDNGYTHGELHDGTLRKAYAAMIAAARSQ